MEDVVAFMYSLSIRKESVRSGLALRFTTDGMMT